LIDDCSRFDDFLLPENIFEIAIVLSLLNFVTLWIVGRIKRNLPDRAQEE